MQSIPVSLEEVFAFWRSNEAWNPKWQAVAKEKGFPDWETWRRRFLERLREVTDPEWTLEEVTDPLEQVSQWYGGPFMGWIKNVYGGQPEMVFSEIIKQPSMVGHDYIAALVTNFPKLTVLAVVEDAFGKMFVVEGMHRACALSVMAQEGKIHTGRVFITRGKLKSGQKLVFNIQP